MRLKEGLTHRKTFCYPPPSHQHGGKKHWQKSKRNTFGLTVRNRQRSFAPRRRSSTVRRRVLATSRSGATTARRRIRPPDIFPICCCVLSKSFPIHCMGRKTSSC